MSPTTNRIVAALVTAVVAGGALAGCGGDSPYCAAVKANEPALKTFGASTTSADFRKEAKAVRAIAATKPEKVAKDWTAIDQAMRAVTAALKKADVTFEDLADPDRRAEVDSDDITAINKAYGAFNDTAPQRATVAKDVDSTCDVSLTPTKEK